MFLFYRDYLSYISSPKLATNFPNFSIKTDIVCKRETPTVTFQFVPSVESKLTKWIWSLNIFITLNIVIAASEKLKRLKIQADNLTVLELLKITNEQVSLRAPKDEIAKSAKTKSEKKGGAVKRK